MSIRELIELLNALPCDQRQRSVLFYANGAYYDVDGLVYGKGALGDSIVLMEGKGGEE